MVNVGDIITVMTTENGLSVRMVLAVLTTIDSGDITKKGEMIYITQDFNKFFNMEIQSSIYVHENEIMEVFRRVDK